MQPPASGGIGEILRLVVGKHGRDNALQLLDAAGIRGRGGGGFPTGHKWWLVASADSQEKFFVCNANSIQPGSMKENWFIRTNPGKVVEAVAIAAYCVGAPTGYIALPESAVEESAALERAVRVAHEAGTLGSNAFGSASGIHVQLIRTPDAYIAGEETALLEFIEGRPLQPRGKPPMPSSAGLYSKPVAVNNLETILQCRYALSVGPEVYRETGTPYAPGTTVFTLHGRVNRPGLYELPLGTLLRDLIFLHGGGMSESSTFKAAFPGGVGSAPLGSSDLDTPLDFDSVRDRGSDLGSGVLVVLAQQDCMVELAVRLAAYFHDASCGKCKPCKDGTARTYKMLTRLSAIDQMSIDISDQTQPPSKRTAQLVVLNNDQPRGISYTDRVTGLDKISHLCEFFQYRGDCHHSSEAANVLMRLLSLFQEEFIDHKQSGVCRLPGFNRLTPPWPVSDKTMQVPLKGQD
jgi:NADH-quinone oxidoreductase subunit F